MDRPKIEELKSICFKCKNVMVADMERVERSPVPHPLGGMAMQEAHIVFFQPFCAARGSMTGLNPEVIVYKCTDFVEREGPLEFKEPKDGPASQERSLLTM